MMEHATLPYPLRRRVFSRMRTAVLAAIQNAMRSRALPYLESRLMPRKRPDCCRQKFDLEFLACGFSEFGESCTI